MQDVAHKETLSYSTISTMLSHSMGDAVTWDRIRDLHTIGIDEISNRKGFKDFVTIVSAKDTKGNLCMLTVLDDHEKETVLDCFHSMFLII